MRNVSLVIWLCLALLHQSYAQIKTAEEWLSISQKEKGKEQIDALNKYAELIVASSPDKSRQAAKDALEKAEDLKYQEGMADAYHKLGLVDYYTDDYENAFNNYDKSMVLAKSLGDKKRMAQALSGTGSIHRVIGEHEKAHALYDEALQLAQEVNDLERVVFCLRSKGDDYRVQQEHLKAEEYLKKALEISDKIGDRFQEAYILTSLGELFRAEGDVTNCLKYLNQALVISQEVNNKLLVGNIYNSLGQAFTQQYNYSEAIDFFNKSLKVAKEINDKFRIADCYVSLGDIYALEGNNEKAIDYYQRASTLAREIKYVNTLAYSLLEIAVTYRKQAQYNYALIYVNQAVDVATSINYQSLLARCYEEIGNNHFAKFSYLKAEEYFNKSLQLSLEIDDQQMVASNYLNLGNIWFFRKDFNKAIDYGKKCLDIIYKIKAFNIGQDVAYLLFKCYNQQNKYEKALEMHILFTSLKDSTNSEDMTKEITRKEMEFEFNQQQEIIKLEQEQKDKEKEGELKRQRLVLIASLSGLAFMVVLAVVIFRSSRKQKLANIILARQKIHIEEQAKEITDSINYAKRIQTAILPDKPDVKKHLPESFIFYRPKDIVSGDFYYFRHIEKAEGPGEIYFAAADCTGHGVPGAFMSLISSQRLEEAALHYSDPAKVLRKLNQSIKQALKQNFADSTSRDGLDIALCHLSETEAGTLLKFSGANRPLWLYRKGEELIEIKGTKASIGGFTDDKQKFDQHEIQLKTGDQIYVFSDGVVDQFGGPDNKKLTSKKFKEQLLKIVHLSMEQQEEALDIFIREWAGNNPQIDDILVIGVKV